MFISVPNPLFFPLAVPYICSHFPEEDMVFSEAQRDQATRSSPGFNLMKTNIFPLVITYLLMLLVTAYL